MMLTCRPDIHPAESRLDTFANLQYDIPQVKMQAAPHNSFPKGLVPGYKESPFAIPDTVLKD